MKEGTSSEKRPSALTRLLARLWAWRAARYWLLFLVAIVGLGLLVPVLPIESPIKIALGNKFALPSSEHWLGTDQLGRDLFSRLLWGIRTSVFTSLVTMALIALVGTVYGITAAMAKEKTDGVMMRAADVMLSFPSEVTVLALVGVMGPGVVSIVVASVIAMWPWYARMARTIVKGLLSRGYVEAAQVSGLSRWCLVKDHILPGALGEFFVLMSLDAGHILLLISTLSFLGLGLQPPTPEWGMMLAESKEVMGIHTWLSWIPGVAILVVVAALSFLGDSLRDALDTRVQRGFDRLEEGAEVTRTATESATSASPAASATSVVSTASTAPRSLVPPLAEGLTVQHLTVSVADKTSATGTRVLVSDVSFGVRQGDALVILGESGAGKTMLARALVDLLGRHMQVSGYVWLDGKPILSMTEDHRATARGGELLYLVQNAMTAFEPLKRVGEQLDAVLQLRLKAEGKVLSAGERRAEIAQVLEQLRLTDVERVMSAYPAELSGGMAQRALLATVMLRRPAVAIVDEPTASLDAQSARDVIEALLTLKADGMTLVIITHDLTLAQRMADRLLVMQAGRVVESGTRHVLTNPADAYTQALIRSHAEKEHPLTALLTHISQGGVGASVAHDLLHKLGGAHRHVASEVRDQGHDEEGLLAHLAEEIEHHQMHHRGLMSAHTHSGMPAARSPHLHAHPHVHPHEHAHPHEHTQGHTPGGVAKGKEDNHE